MSATEGPPQPTTHTAEITVVTGECYVVQGDVKDVERMILNAARGSIMQLAWLTDADTKEEFGINPDHVVRLRASRS
jgi:uncharacterized protein YlzI (FlbEa/FlbD family)